MAFMKCKKVSKYQCKEVLVFSKGVHRNITLRHVGCVCFRDGGGGGGGGGGKWDGGIPYLHFLKRWYLVRFVHLM